MSDLGTWPFLLQQVTPGMLTVMSIIGLSFCTAACWSCSSCCCLHTPPSLSLPKLTLFSAFLSVH